MSIHTIADIGLVISEARAAGRPCIVVLFTKDDAPNCLSDVGLPQLYFDQLRIMRRHIDNTVLEQACSSGRYRQVATLPNEGCCQQFASGSNPNIYRGFSPQWLSP
jgi:hypothetical protein